MKISTITVLFVMLVLASDVHGQMVMMMNPMMSSGRVRMFLAMPMRMQTSQPSSVMMPMVRVMGG